MRKQIEIWKVAVLGGLLFVAYLAGISAGAGGSGQAVASPAGLGFPDSGAQLNQMIKSLDDMQATLRISNGHLNDIHELLKSGKLQVVVQDNRPNGGTGSSGGSGGNGGSGSTTGSDAGRPASRVEAVRPPLSRLVEQ